MSGRLLSFLPHIMKAPRKLKEDENPEEMRHRICCERDRG